MKIRTPAQREWAVVALGIAGAAALLVFGRGSPTGAQPQGDSRVTVTVVASDAHDLSCKGPFVLEGTRCGFGMDDRPVPDAAPLKPFMSVERRLWLLGGFFEDARVSAWIAKARGEGSNARVVVRCEAMPLGIVPEVEIRWTSAGSWSREHDVQAARVSNCSLAP